MKILQEKHPEISDRQLLDWAVADMLRYVDPTAKYICATDSKEFEAKPGQGIGTIGVIYSVPNSKFDTICLVAAGSSADKAGLRPGDEIIKIDGKQVCAPCHPAGSKAKNLR